MAAQNWQEKYLTNPETANQDDDLFYFARAPYGSTDDGVINWQDFSGQFILDLANSVSFANLPAISDNHILGNDTGSTAVPGTIAIGSGLTMTGSVLSVTGGGVTPGNIQANSYNYAVDTGIQNAIVAAFTPAITVGTAGLTVFVKVANTISIANPTLDVGFGAKLILQGLGSSLFSTAASTPINPDISANHVYEFIWDAVSDNWKVINPNSAYDNPQAMQQTRFNRVADSGTTNVYVAPVQPVIGGSNTIGTLLYMTTSNTNTGASTLAFNLNTALPIVLGNGSALTGGEMVAGQIAALYCTSTTWQLLNPVSGGSGLTQPQVMAIASIGV